MDQKGDKAPPGFPNAGQKAPSRRGIIAAGAALVAAGTATQIRPVQAQAQGTDAGLAQLQASRRILIKGGVVLTLTGTDFANADVLIEDGKIREIRPEITEPGDIPMVDATNRILTPR